MGALSLVDACTHTDKHTHNLGYLKHTMNLYLKQIKKHTHTTHTQTITHMDTNLHKHPLDRRTLALDALRSRSG
jgi:hypothetical protein